jgi:hypothetical protein
MKLGLGNSALSLEHQKYIRIQIAADELPLGLVPFSAHILVIEPCCPILVFCH